MSSEANGTASSSVRCLADARVLVVGLGGLGCPAVLALAEAGIGRLVLLDDDVVEEENLHRQFLYRDVDSGRHKVDAAGAALEQRGISRGRIELRHGRLLAGNALELLRGVDLVVEGSDNYATKFLAADASHLAGKPAVLGAALRWAATVWAIDPHGRPCYRCLFEDPPEVAPSCAEAGVMGPVVGVAGALMAELAIQTLLDERAMGPIYTYDGKTDRLRAVEVAAREDCTLCGVGPTITELDEARYPGTPCPNHESPPPRQGTPIDRYARQRRLAEVGDVGQARLAELEVVLADSESADLEGEFLLRAGVRGVITAPGCPAPLPHEAHFTRKGPRRVATGAWRALKRIRTALDLEH
ncbi:MAG: HesA/MoeB/ThiF family protein [Polyangiaceae bacterium]|nr:HesA/MoeB/ThiF family protein [Polyangiaceae bacterium]